MAIYFPPTDNPIDSGRLPNVELPYAFPLERTETVSTRRVQQIVVATIAILATIFAVIVLLGESLGSEFGCTPHLQAATSASVFAFLTLVVLRFWGRGAFLPELLIASAVAVAIVVFVDNSQGLQLQRLFAAILLVWCSLEFAVHWVETNPAPISSATVDYRLSAAVVLAIINSATLALSIRNAFFMLILNVCAFGVLFCGRGTSFVGFLRFAFRSYYAYPARSATPTGLIQSPAASPMLRPLPAALSLFVLLLGRVLEQAHSGNASLGLDSVMGVLAALTLICTTAALCAIPFDRSNWSDRFQHVVESNRHARSPILRDSLFLGVADADGSPILVHRSLLLEHVHFLGRTGSGKTAMGLIPLIEQLVSLQHVSNLVLDLKGDTTELAASYAAAIDTRTQLDGAKLPLRVFTLKSGESTHGFNPFLARDWDRLTLTKKSETLSNALGLQYGPGYGKDFFGDSGNTLVYTALSTTPNIRSFRELLDAATRVLQAPKSELMLEPLKKASVHAWQVIARLAAIDAVNILPGEADREVIDNMIDLADCFESPQVIIVRLPSTTSAKTASAIANLFLQMLLVAGEEAERQCSVYVVVDEFQRMAVDSLTQVFQLARSQGVGLIIANQSQQDLRRASETLAATVDDSCHWRQWFSVSGEDATKLVEQFGQREELLETLDGQGYVKTRQTVRTQRADHALLAKVSDDPCTSIVRVTGDRVGFGKYQGLPFVARSDFHITVDEYRRRRAYEWPSNLAGLMPATESPVGLPAPKRKNNSPPPTEFNGEFNPDLFED